jgi:peptidoglycan/LPS O-acetylase OafA/YrhL
MDEMGTAALTDRICSNPNPLNGEKSLQKLKSIEMLRGLAAVLVVLYHSQTICELRAGYLPFGGIFSGGSHGVDLFFVLSGFIICHVHKADFGRPNRLPNYIFNRAARIFPAVWIMTSVALVFYLAGYGGSAKAGKLSAYNVFASFTLFPQLGDALVNVTWTLKYEIFFYLIFAAFIINKRLGITLLVFWQFSALILSSLFSIRQLGLAGFYVTSLCLEFGIGLLCAWILDVVIGSRKSEIQRPALLVLLSVAGAILFVLGMTTEAGGFGNSAVAKGTAIAAHTWSINSLCALGSALLIISFVLLERAGRLKVPRLLVFLGDASYSIYIVHFSVVTLLCGFIARHRLPINDIVYVSVAGIGIIAGSMFHIFIDKPLHNFLRARVRPTVVHLASA